MKQKMLTVQALSRRLTKGSWVVALLATFLFLRSDRYDFDGYLIWQSLLVVVWLYIGSALISWAYRRGREFEADASASCGSSPGSPWLGQERQLRSVWLLAISAPLMTIGLLATLGLPGPPGVRLFHVLTVCLCFYYASFGLWGAYVVTRSVRRTAEFAHDQQRLRLFHADRLGGLGCLSSYADTASLLLFSGILVLPMGTAVTRKWLGTGTLKGTVLGLVCVATIAVWISFTLLPALRGRLAIAASVRRFRNSTLNRLAQEKSDLFATGASQAQWDLLELQETAALRLRTGMFFGAGGWKDMLNTVSMCLEIVATIKGLGH